MGTFFLSTSSKRNTTSTPTSCNIIAYYYIDKSVLVEWTTRKFYTKLHPGLQWRIFYILTSEDIDDVISHSYTVVCAKILVYIIEKENHTVA